jgi:phage terminase large subunit-like protein
MSSKRLVKFHTGASALLFSAEEPDRLRGLQFDSAWLDEMGSWKYAQDTWDMLQFGLRLGDSRQMITTTPKVEWLSLIKEIMNAPSTITTVGTTYENLDNLSGAFRQSIVSKYEGTTLGRQELEAALLDQIPDALWKRKIIEDYRLDAPPCDMQRIVVAIDPQAKKKVTSAETGIIVCGLGEDYRGYLLADGTCRASPKGWATAALNLYEEWEADAIVAEVNQGGDMVEQVIRDIHNDARVIKVHATRGKRTRAEPISSKYEQGKISHIGTYRRLEDQMCSVTPDTQESPDRMDAMVWGFTELMVKRGFMAYMGDAWSVVKRD